MAREKKSFTGNPALNFISAPAPVDDQHETREPVQPEPAEEPVVNANAPEKKSSKEQGRETKSRRCNFLMYPSAYDSLAMLAVMQQTSVNALISDIVQRYVDDNKETIKKYNEIFGGKR